MNVTMSRTHGYTPFEVMFGTKFPALFDEELGNLIFEDGNPDGYVRELRRILGKTHAEIHTKFMDY